MNYITKNLRRASLTEKYICSGSTAGHGQVCKDKQNFRDYKGLIKTSWGIQSDLFIRVLCNCSPIILECLFSITILCNYFVIRSITFYFIRFDRCTPLLLTSANSLLSGLLSLSDTLYGDVMVKLVLRYSGDNLEIVWR